MALFDFARLDDLHAWLAQQPKDVVKSADDDAEPGGDEEPDDMKA